jgi:hypothetical protein
MRTIKWSPWIAYFVVYVGGFAGLMYLARTSSAGSPALYLPFAFPVVLLAIAALAERAEPVSQVVEEESTSILGRGLVFRRYPMQWTTVVGFTLITPFYTWVYPRDVGERLRVTFDIWWLAFAAFTFFLLPRLLRTTQRL